MFAYCAHIQTLLRGHKYTLFIDRSSARWILEKSVEDLREKTGDIKTSENEIL